MAECKICRRWVASNNYLYDVHDSCCKSIGLEDYITGSTVCALTGVPYYNKVPKILWSICFFALLAASIGLVAVVCVGIIIPYITMQP